MMKSTSSIWIPYLTVVFAALENTISNEIMPEFDTSVINVTAIAGTTAVLPCSVQNIGRKSIAWLNPKKILIAQEDRRIMDDTRLSIERPLIPDWNLHIRSVRYDDRGMYACTLNTDPVKVKRIYLIVLVPPDIDEQLSSGSQIVREGATVRLHCNATGKPQPKITWYRKTIYSQRETKEVIGRPGDFLIIHNISRYCDGIYECVASNGVSRDVSKEIMVEVQYKPEVRVYSKKLKQKRGKETILSCEIAASPQGVGLWRKGNQKFHMSSRTKHRVEMYVEEPKRVTLRLIIQDVEEEDYGEYTCEASNSLGSDSEDMYLFELVEVTTTKSLLSNESQKDRRPNAIIPPVRRPTTRGPQHPKYGIKNGNIYRTDIIEMEYSKRKSHGIASCVRGNHYVLYLFIVFILSLYFT